MADDVYFAGSGFKVGVMTQSDFYDPDPDADETAPIWSSVNGKKVGACSGWEFNVQFELKKLYAMSSIKRIGIARTKAKITGKLDFYKFDPNIGTTTGDDTFWVMDIHNSSGGGSVADTSKITWFMLYGSVLPAGVGSVLGAKVYNVEFDNIQIEAQAYESIGWDLSFTGTIAEITNAEVTFT